MRGPLSGDRTRLIPRGAALLDRSSEVRDTRPPRQPIFNIPGPILAVLVVLLGLHAVRQVIPAAWDDALFTRLAFVPGRVTFAFAPDRVIGAVVDLARQGTDGYRAAQAERFFLGDGALQLWTSVSYALIHADWAHVGLNAIWLLAFGTPMARRLGTWRFLAFLTVTAWAGAAVQWAAHPLDLAPVIGASAAVSGCMGATLRFMFQPRVRIAASTEFGTEGSRQASLQPALTLRGTMTDRRALSFLVAWFATNLLFGIGSISLGIGSGPIAWEAHIGGFFAGLLLFPLFDRAPGVASPDLAPSAPDEPAERL